MDKFFNQSNCDRCGQSLQSGRIMSWFTTETICLKCAQSERQLKQKLRAQGTNTDELEGCGYIPRLKEIK